MRNRKHMVAIWEEPQSVIKQILNFNRVKEALWYRIWDKVVGPVFETEDRVRRAIRDELSGGVEHEG